MNNIAIIPVIQHKVYAVGESYFVKKDNHWNYQKNTSLDEITAFHQYKKLVVENERYKSKHPRSFYPIEVS